MEMQRVIELDMPVNFRDLGGYQGLDGRQVKWRKIYRSAALNEMSARDRVKLANLRITVDCDLRS
ncbi:protein-tyrosine-phosphatase, partial [Lactobacillus delbrueckii subsp. bulgaricus]|nr:protein-tyrosine-phosphatase [Lactobacillus delbrueckii subsp. bulgaricus]